MGYAAPLCQNSTSSNDCGAPRDAQLTTLFQLPPLLSCQNFASGGARKKRIPPPALPLPVHAPPFFFFLPKLGGGGGGERRPPRRGFCLRRPSPPFWVGGCGGVSFWGVFGRAKTPPPQTPYSSRRRSWHTTRPPAMWARTCPRR